MVVTTALFALLYRVLPDVRLHWRDVMTGAFVTAVLFTIGQQLIGLYLGQSSVTSSYGAAGSVMVLLLWVYYSCQILLFGAEFTRVYAQRHGVRPHPESFAQVDGSVRHPSQQRLFTTGRAICSRRTTVEDRWIQWVTRRKP